MRVKNRPFVIGMLLIGLGAAILFEQYHIYGEVFNLNEVLHHEFFAGILFSAAATLLGYDYLRR